MFKHNCQVIEEKLTMRTDSRRRTVNSEVIAMLRLLQEASLVGNVFSSKLLAQVSRRSLTVPEIKAALDTIEDFDLIEMLYNESNGEWFYRFNHPGTLQTLYQMQCFSVRQSTLMEVIKFMKDNIVQNKTTEWDFKREFALMMRYSLEH